MASPKPLPPLPPPLPPRQSAPLPPLAHQAFLEQLELAVVKQQQKKIDFFILFQSKGINNDGTLPDAAFADRLRELLEHEVQSNNKPMRVHLQDAHDVRDMEAAMNTMSQSYVVVTIFSELALNTFSGTAHNDCQSDFLLLLQMAYLLQLKRGLRMVGLNLIEVMYEGGEEHRVKFEGWKIPFENVEHHSEWIQDKISDSMSSIFSIQGVGVDYREADFKYKIRGLRSVLQSAHDDLNSVGWVGILYILPWATMSVMWAVFFSAFFAFPVALVAVGLWYWRSKEHLEKKGTILNVAIYGAALCIIGGGILFASILVVFDALFPMCVSDIICEYYVSRGILWSYWIYVMQLGDTGCFQTCGSLSQWNKGGYSKNCAECVCQDITSVCNVLIGDTTSAFSFLIIVCLVIGFLLLAFLLYRSYRYASAERAARFKLEVEGAHSSGASVHLGPIGGSSSPSSALVV